MTQVLRPVIDRILEPLPAIVARVPQDMTDRRAQYNLTSNRPAVAAWSHLETVHRKLTEVHDLADTLRRAGLIPTRGNRHPEDYRWLHHDRLEGSTLQPIVLLADGYRADAGPGIYTESELTAAHQATEGEAA